jgi:hypothetical protein
MKKLFMKRLAMSLLLVVAYMGDAEAQTCMQPAETQAFNILALKSALMVGALSCNQGEQYNIFMANFQADIAAEQHAMDAYFIRAAGLAAQSQEDAYETALANSQSQMSLALGGGFCQANSTLFNQVLALQTVADLNRFITANPPSQPISMTVCAPVRPAPARHPTEIIAAAPAAKPTEAAEAAAALTVNEPPVHETPLAPPAYVRQAHIRRHVPPAVQVAAKKPPAHPAPIYLTTQMI